MSENYSITVTRQAVNSHEYSAHDTLMITENADKTQADPESVIAAILINVIKRGADKYE